MLRNLSKAGGFRKVVASRNVQQPHSLTRFLSATQSHSVNTVTGTDTELKANPVRAKLTLEDGSVYEGISFGAEKNVNGEVVFSTGMTGYTESLTDPSYRGQILSLTYPMIGNYGVPSTSDMDKYGLRKGFESHMIHATALLCQDYAYTYSHWDAKMSLSQWLKQEGIPGIHGIDTRLITKKVRTKGAMLGRIEFEGQPGVTFADPNGRNLVAEVSTKEVKIFGKGMYMNTTYMTCKCPQPSPYPISNLVSLLTLTILCTGNKHKILAVDCGIKSNIIRELVDRGAEVKLVPWDYNIYDDLKNVDGRIIHTNPPTSTYP